MERRDFIKSAVASAVTAGATLSDSGQAQSSARTSNPVSRPMSPDMQYRDLGRTGEKVSVIGLGGYHLGRQADPRKVCAWSEPRSIAALPSWTTVGTTTTGLVKSAWVRRYATAIAARFS